MGVDLLPDEHVLWQGRPAHHSVFVGLDLRWIRFSLKFNAVKIVLIAVLAFLTGAFLDHWPAAWPC